MSVINLSGIMHGSIVDGPGFRTTVFAQGCLRACPGCHNPETAAVGCGTDLSVDNIVARIQSNPLDKGVTFSGGEPFLQAKGFAELAMKLHEKGYEVACYTGYTFEELWLQGSEDQKILLQNIDVLIDGPFIQSKKSLLLAFRGSSNQRLLDAQKSCEAGRACLTQNPKWTLEDKDDFE